jgi:hypothetical protein
MIKQRIPNLVGPMNLKQNLGIPAASYHRPSPIDRDYGGQFDMTAVGRSLPGRYRVAAAQERT